MGRDIQDGWKKIDRLMWEIRNEIRFLERITPANAQTEKETFLQHWRNGTQYNPEFIYDLGAFNADTVNDRLETCETLLKNLAPAPHEPEIVTLYENTLDELRSEHTILTHIGDSNIVQEETTTIYGQPPTNKEVQTGKNVLSTIRERNTTGKHRASDLHTACREMLDALELTDWAVTYTDAHYPSASAAEKALRVPNPLQDRTYLAGEPTTVAAHEVSHGLRAANGYNQPYNLFATGVNGYHTTDEGLSILLEFAHGQNHTDVIMSALRRYALRVIAADTASNGATYWETFTTLMDYTAQEDEAWHVAFRAYRAGSGTYGGVIKDHIYQRGLTHITNRLAHSDDPKQVMETLYIGKYGLGDHLTVHQLREHGILNPPEYLPFQVLGQDKIIKMAERIVDQDLGTILQPAT